MVNKKLVAAGVVMSIFAGSLVGCGGSSEEGNGGDSEQVYFLNFKFIYFNLVFVYYIFKFYF